jgi:hypothetical protein
MTQPSGENCNHNERRGRDHGTTLREDGKLRCHREHLLPLEPEILERFGCTAVQHRRPTLVAAPCCKVALGDPRGSTV